MIIDDAGGMVFRPPSEARSFILRVTIGCSHNSCLFCTMYKDSKFRIRSWDEIKGIIHRAKAAMPYIRRVFLADGDALVLPTPFLLRILKECYTAFPNLTRVGTYATTADINRKTAEELTALKKGGLKIVYVGIESGSNAVLSYINKGVTKEETIRACHNILTADMKLSVMVLLGLGGQTYSHVHALETAEVISAVNPTMLSALTLMIPDDAPLAAAVNKGEFLPLTARGFLTELQLMLEHIHVSAPCIFRSNHVSNLLALAGTLPKDKEALLAQLRPAIPRLDNVLPLRNNTGNF
ncbi:radical SAM protein [Colibacter massiliensis]|uniref:radical SAM protein n=1 Tax=Colibacter massiliensis TaxID=1852379 RepID=UPI003F93D3D9